MEDLTFKTERKRKSLRYLTFLPKSLRPLVLSSIILNFINIIVAAISYPGLQKTIPLFYSRPEDQQLISKEGIFILPLFATLINLLHISLLRLVREQDRTILRVFVFAGIALEALALAILIRTIRIIY